MKKISFIILCCLCLCGCNNKMNGYQLSELSAEPLYDENSNLYEIIGSIKNISNDKCNDENNEIMLIIELSNGDIKDENVLVITSPKKGEIDNFREVLSTKLKNFKIKIKKITCW